ncbi:MAG: F0F1 ATP synthase subunit A [Chloroflexota bacterium]
MQFSQITMMAVAAAEEAGEHGAEHGSGLASPIFFHLGPIPVSYHIFSAWIVMAVLVIVSILATRNMQLVPRGLQNFVEFAIETLLGLVDQTAGPKGRAFAPVVMTAFLFILTANWMGTLPLYGHIEGFESPNSNLNVTAAMAIIVFVLCQVYAIRTNGIGGYIKEFIVPNPLHILTELSRPLSLSLRLFGNIYAGGVLVHTMLGIAPFITFVFLGLELFVGAVQALIFTMLTLVFLTIAVTPHHGEHDDAHGDAHAPAHH